MIVALKERVPHLDIERVQDVGLRDTDDPSILEWAAMEGRVLLTSDRRTMIGFAYERVDKGLPMPGILLLNPDSGIGELLEELQLIAQVGTSADFENQVIHLPL